MLFATTPKANSCKSFASNKATIYLNKKMSEKYPQFDFMLKDPEIFLKEMRARFENQKRITPDTPLRFDFSELGIPELKVITEKISEEIKELREKTFQLSASHIYQNPNKLTDFITLFTRKQNSMKELSIGIQYLKDLQAEIHQILEKGKIDYLKFNEIAYFYARASGYFDRDGMRWRDRFMLVFEARIQGYKKFNIEEEYKFYKTNDFNLSRGRSLWSENRHAMEKFKKQFSAKDKLPFIIIPSHSHLGPDIFHRLMASDIHIVGITRNPIGADGFLRPGGLFWIHDAVHSALINFTKEQYLNENRINQKMYEKMRPQIDQWFVELEAESKAIEAKEFRRVTRRLIFNIHHDRGYPLVPSMLLNLKKMPKTAYALYFLLENFGHGVKMEKGSYKYLQESYQWIFEFWSKRAEQEQILLEKLRKE